MANAKQKAGNIHLNQSPTYHPHTLRWRQRLRAHVAFLILLTFAATLFLSDIWGYKQFIRAESYFAVGARLMIEQDAWLTPHAPDEAQLNKPPLTYWLIGICYKLFGMNYGAARLPSVLSALITLTIVYLLGLKLDGRRAGLISAALLASSYTFFSFARIAMSDMLLTLFVCCALATFINALMEQTRRSQKLVLIGYVALALGVLAKGPVALVLIAVPVIVELATSRMRADLKRLRLLAGLLVSLLTVAPYFLLIYIRKGVGPLRFFFVGENIQRFSGEIYGFGARPFWYETVAFFGDFAPFSLLIFLAMWLDWRRRRYDETARHGRRMLYFWLACTICFFSLSSFKRDYYLLPAMPAAALIIGRVFARADELPVTARRAVEIFLLIWAIVVFIAGLFSLRVAEVVFYESPLRFLPAMIALAGLALVVLFVVRGRVWFTALTLTLTILATLGAMQLILTPSLARYLPATRLAASVPAEKVLYTSSDTSKWANDLLFNLTESYRVERLAEDVDTTRLQEFLRDDPLAIAVVSQQEYSMLLEKGMSLKILAQADTFGPGGLKWNELRQPTRDRLFLIVDDR